MCCPSVVFMYLLAFYAAWANYACSNIAQLNCPVFDCLQYAKMEGGGLGDPHAW